MQFSETGEVLINIFLSVLGLLGYSAVPSGNVVKIVPNLESGEMATRVATATAPGQGDEVVVRVIALEHVSAEQLIPSLRPLLPQWSNISAYAPGNTLILLGRASNIERIIDIIHNVDQASNNDIDMVALKHASATQVANVLNNLQNAARSGGGMGTVVISADERSNSILLSGNKSARLRMRVIISQLDSPTAGAQGNTEVVYLRYLQAKTLAPILGKIADNLIKGGSTETKESSANTLPGGPAGPTPPFPPYGPMMAQAMAAANIPGKPKAATPENLTNIQAELNTNALIITAPRGLMQALKGIIAKLDVRPAQVYVEAVIVEVNQDELKNLGITWGSTDVAAVAANTITPASPTGSTLNFPALGAGFVGIIPQTPIKAVLSALQNQTAVNILSTPSIVVLDNHKAVLEVGKSVPWQNGSYATTGNTSTVTPFTTTESKPVTLTLTVTPQINLGCAVRLAIELKNDSLQNPQNPGLNPIINTSKIKNSVVINSGDVLVIGGLISNSVTESNLRVPILGDLPIIGRLFQNKGSVVEKQTLVAFIKPVILHDDQDSMAITNSKYDVVRNTQINWPIKDLSNLAKQKQENILPLFNNNIELPAPFGG